MHERFTESARRVVVLAQGEALLLKHDYIGTEHLLLGLIHEGQGGGVAVEVLRSLGVTLEVVRNQVEEIIGHGRQAPVGHMPFTPRAKKVLELSYREMLQLNDLGIGPEHILFGLIREGEGVATQVLAKLGVDLDRLKRAVLNKMVSPLGEQLGTNGFRVKLKLPVAESLEAWNAFNAPLRALGHTKPIEVVDILNRLLTKLRDSDGAEIEELFTGQEREILLAWWENLQSAYLLPIDHPLSKVLAAIENADRTPSEEEQADTSSTH